MPDVSQTIQGLHLESMPLGNWKRAERAAQECHRGERFRRRSKLAALVGGFGGVLVGFVFGAEWIDRTVFCALFGVLGGLWSRGAYAGFIIWRCEDPIGPQTTRSRIVAGPCGSCGIDLKAMRATVEGYAEYLADDHRPLAIVGQQCRSCGFLTCSQCRSTAWAGNLSQPTVSRLLRAYEEAACVKCGETAARLLLVEDPPFDPWTQPSTILAR